MSKLAIISGHNVGLTANKVNANIGASGIDIAAWTPAENHLMAVKRNLQIYAAYTGDPKGIYKKGIDQVENAITGKVTDFSFNGIQIPSLDGVNRNIQYAKSLVKNTDFMLLDAIEPDVKFASFGYGITTQSLALPAVNKEKWIWNFMRTQEVIRTDISEATIKNATNDYTSLNKDHLWKYVMLSAAGKKFGIVNVTTPDVLVDKIWKFIGDQFISFNKFRNALYDKYEPTAHHVLYEFIENPLSENPTVQAKRLNHRQALDVISRAAYIDRATMTLWTENGINAAYVKGQNEPIGGRATIDELKAINNPKIGNPVAIIAAIAGALTAAATFVNSIKGTPQGEFISEVNGYSTPSYGASPDDFPYSASNQGSGSNELIKYLPYGLIGLGALYFLTNRKKLLKMASQEDRLRMRMSKAVNEMAANHKPGNKKTKKKAASKKVVAKKAATKKTSK